MRHFKRSKYVLIYKVRNTNDGQIWVHREFFRSIDDLIKFENTKKNTYEVVQDIYRGSIKRAPGISI